MSVTSVFRQSVYCINTNDGTTFIHDVWGPDIFTTCPGDIPYHNFQLSAKTDNVSSNEVVSIPNVDGTNHRYNCQGIEFDVAAGPATDYTLIGTHIFPKATRLESVKFTLDANNDSDYVNGDVTLPSYISDKLAENVNGGNVIKLSVLGIIAARPQYQITLKEGILEEYIGNVVSVNSLTSEVTVSNTITNSFTTNADVIIKNLVIRNLKLFHYYDYNIGGSITGSIQFPAGTKLGIYYKNKTSAPKTFSFYMEYFD